MTPLQQKEFEMLEWFVKVCGELGIDYYLVCGTALGAKKYGGFIPWDDDVDVALLRDDYELFIREAQKLLPDWIFVQNYHSDPEFPQIYTKLRNSNTTYIETSVASFDINHGIYIDVFPIDGYPEETGKSRQFELKKRIYNSLLLSVCDIKHSVKSRIVDGFIKTAMGIHSTSQVADRYTKLLEEYPPKSSKLWCNHGNWQGKLEYAPREQYGNGSWEVFEGLKVRVPGDCNAYLTQKYGEWREDIADNDKKGHHYCTICDLNKSFIEYTKGGKNEKDI